MDKLPIELLEKIFTYLHIQQKIQCMLTCRLWNRILFSEGLIVETININDMGTKKSLAYQIKFWAKYTFDEKSNYGDNCRRLFIDSYSLFKFDMATLAKSFPFLKVLSIILKSWDRKPAHQDIEVFSASDTTQKSDPFNNWRNNIETLVINVCDATLLFEVLVTGVFQKLSRLVLCIHKEIPSSYVVDIFKQFKNVSMLSIFCVTIPRISKPALEELHRNTPHLVELALKFKGLISFEDSEHLDVVEFTQLDTLSITCNSESGINKRGLLAYIKNKYTCLRKFTLFSDRYNDEIVIEAGEIQDSESNTIWSDDYFPTQDNERYEDTFLGYGPDEFIDKLHGSSKIKKLSMDLCYSEDGFGEALSKTIFHGLTNIQLNRIPPNQDLSSLKEIDGLRKLSLNYSNKNVGKNSFSLYEYGDKPKVTVELNILLAALPKSIEALSLKHINLNVDKKKLAQQQQNYGIVHLKLRHITIGPSVSQFIGIYLPSLKYLVLYRFYSDYEFTLPNHRLSCVKLIPEYKEYWTSSTCEPKPKGGRIHLLLTRENQSYYYTVPFVRMCYLDRLGGSLLDKHDLLGKSALRPHEFNEDLEYFHFKCENVETIYFDNFLIL